jgi:hypothetical protein
VVPAGGERGVTGRALALAKSGDINLPTLHITVAIAKKCFFKKFIVLFDYHKNAYY